MNRTERAVIVWKPQPRQLEFMRRPEPEALYGGAAGGGKSDALLIEALRQAGDILCTEPGTPDERRKNIMGQTKPAAGLKSLNRAADTLSTLLAQEVKELNERQKAARRENTPDPGMMKGLKEATAVLKDLAGVVKTLNDQGTELEGTECGVVLLPPVEQEEKE